MVPPLVLIFDTARLTHDQGREKTDAASDIPAEYWLFRLAPPATKPYLTLARVDRPIGTWLLLLPCWWGAALAGGDLVQLAYFALLFAIGAFVMRGSGCVWNDILDRDYDKKVSRTALRPIASGVVGVRAAAIFMAVLAICGLLVLLQFNNVAIVIALSSLVLAALYPLMKRNHTGRRRGWGSHLTGERWSAGPLSPVRWMHPSIIYMRPASSGRSVMTRFMRIRTRRMMF